MLFPECLALRAGGNGIKTGFKDTANAKQLGFRLKRRDASWKFN